MTRCILLLLAALIVPAPHPITASGASSIAAVNGTASWYATSGPGIYAAAGPALRVGHWRGSVVSVNYNGRTLNVRLTDFCACPKRVIDLSRDAFAHFADPSVGLIHVRVEFGGPALPATDTLP